MSPCYTLVIYFGEKPWDGPKCLSDMLVLDATMAKYFNDYKMNLIEVRDGPEGFQFKSEEVRKLEEAEKQKMEAEIALLKSQIENLKKNQ